MVLPSAVHSQLTLYEAVLLDNETRCNHPDRVQSFSLPFGKARVFYPEASEGLCTAALILDIDPASGDVEDRHPDHETRVL